VNKTDGFEQSFIINLRRETACGKAFISGKAGKAGKEEKREFLEDARKSFTYGA